MEEIKQEGCLLLQVGFVDNSPWSRSHTVTVMRCGQHTRAYDLTWGRSWRWDGKALPTLAEVAHNLGPDVLWVRRYTSVMQLPNWSHPQRPVRSDDFEEELITPAGAADRAHYNSLRLNLNENLNEYGDN
jgi:hypothetical protein